MPDHARHHRRRADHGGRPTGAFWLVGLVVLTFLAASSAPTPLYVVLPERMGVLGTHPHHRLRQLRARAAGRRCYGRRHLRLPRPAARCCWPRWPSRPQHGRCSCSPTTCRCWWPPGSCRASRPGPTLGVASAALVDLQPAGTQLAGVVNGAGSTGGLALGALGVGAAGAAVPGSTHLVFVVLLVALVVLAVPVWRLPETVRRRPGALGRCGRGSPYRDRRGRRSRRSRRSWWRPGRWARCTSRSARRSPPASSA